jgi:glycosyltransferase involved in cell wall biosynthesis
VPKADITHSSAAAFCGLPGVIAKLLWGTPYLLTEHGVNIREQYLNLNHSIPSFFVRQFLYRFMSTVVRLNYHFADQISPVCEYNSRWEKWWGVPSEKIKVIYNGADPEKFHPTPPVKRERPLIVNIGLIFPLKGQVDLIEAAAIVREKIPNVEFRFYGKPSDEAYFAECQKRVAKYQLEETIVFAGFTSEPWRAYSEADVVAMASISEGFPYAVIEAMLSAATIVSTDVGGVREALGDTGLLVRSSCPVELAEAILKLLLMPADERSQLGKRACDRALELFTLNRCMEEHLNSYQRLHHQQLCR